jgi:hypothetical protein
MFRKIGQQLEFGSPAEAATSSPNRLRFDPKLLRKEINHGRLHLYLHKRRREELRRNT